MTARQALMIAAAFLTTALSLSFGGAVPIASAQTIQVLSATPNAAEQGTFSLPVTIRGSGFKKGAKARFYLPNSTNPGGITVASTRFIDSTHLVATIDIADTAVVSGFDIVVESADGRTGKGTELLFEVVERISDELSAQFQDAAEDMVRSDLLGIYAWPLNFKGGQVIFNHQYGHVDFQAYLSTSGRSATFEFEAANNVRDAVAGATVECRAFDGTPFPAPEPAPDWLAGGFPTVSYFLVRTQSLVVYTVVNGVGVWTSAGGSFNVRAMAVGSTAIVGALISFKDNAGRQFSLYFNEHEWDGKKLPYVSGFVKVRRQDESTWVLEPLGADDPMPLGALNQAQLSMYVPELRRVHPAGKCDIGDWVMPFKITFTSVR